MYNVHTEVVDSKGSYLRCGSGPHTLFQALHSPQSQNVYQPIVCN